MNMIDQDSNGSIRLCVGSNWDDRLITELSAINAHLGRVKVYEVFGALARSVIGTGRGADCVPAVTVEHAYRHIAKAQSFGIRFNYLINSASFGNREYTETGQKEIANYFGVIRGLNVDSVTVAVPILVPLVKHYLPGIEIHVSTIAHVDARSTLRFWQDLGVARVIPSYMINRNFDLLKALAKGGTPEIEVMANDTCLYGCALRDYHHNTASNGSQCSDTKSSDYPFYFCTKRRLDSPGEFIKARWIRPEDLCRYHDFGIRYIKLAGREKPTDWLINCAKHYAAMRSPENLLDILAITLPSIPDRNGDVIERPVVRIHSHRLNGFLDHFDKIGSRCDQECGDKCRYCEQVAASAVTVTYSDTARNYAAGLEQRISISGRDLLRNGGNSDEQ